MRKRVSKAKGITAKLVSAIVISVVLAVSALLVVVYSRVSDAFLTKSEELLQATTGKTIQETSAWMNRTLTMLETQRDTIEYKDMDIPEMEAYIKHTVDQNEAYPAGLYVALTDGSLEAARVGEAGKGFAVVAEEVRSLASRSAEAARETTVLLGETVGSIDEGTRAAQETSESMLAVVTHADEMSGLIDSIAENTSRQAEGAAEIAHGIEQISSVVDSNADNAQRSAAASEELSGQAEMLKNLVAAFKIRGAENRLLYVR